MDLGPTPLADDYLNHDMILFVSLAAQPLSNPMLGVGVSGVPLMTRGISGNPAFGGSGPTLMTSIDPNNVWVTLAPNGATDFTVSADGITTSIPMLLPGEALYLETDAEICAADITADAVVNVFDLLALIGAWGVCPDPGNCAADLNGDNTVNVLDLLELISAWGACP
ncbi:MAG: dockerin type I domain-containing protein [Phycisphaerales bacterium]|nr:dockerin type I domain-containing protein [Phycisphaerales bacterium]